jgi:Transcriptional regulator PadR-like family
MGAPVYPSPLRCARSTVRNNATVGSLLGFLHDGPQSGWDLVDTAQQAIGDFWSLTRSQVYRELTTMAADGLIEADEVGPGTGGRTGSPTPDGRHSGTGSGRSPAQSRFATRCS